MTLHLNVCCVLYLEVLVIAKHLHNILFCHYSKIVFEYESLAIFARNTQYSCTGYPPHLFTCSKHQGFTSQHFNHPRCRLIQGSDYNINKAKKGGLSISYRYKDSQYDIYYVVE